MNLYQKAKLKVLNFLVKSGELVDSKNFTTVFSDWLKSFNGSNNVSIVSSCANIWMYTFSKAKFRLYDKDEDDSEVTDHPIINILEKPFPGITSWDMKARIALDFIYEGRSYLYKLRDGFGVVRGLYPLFVHNVINTYPYGLDYVEYYEYQAANGIMKIPREDVIFLRRIDNKTLTKGVAIIDGISDTMAIIKLRNQYRRTFLEKGGFIGPVFTTEQQLNTEPFNQLYDLLKSKFSGSKNAFEFGLFHSGLKPVATAYSPKDMKLPEDTELDIKEVRAAFGMNKIFLGDSELVQRGNAETVYYIFYDSIIDPILSSIDETLTDQLEVDFSLNGYFPYYIKHDKLASNDVELDLKYYQNGLQNGWLRPSQVRKEEGMEIDPELDAIWLERMRSKTITQTAN